MDIENLYVPAKRFIPEVDLNVEKRLLRFSGECYHEYTEEFFAPIFEWTDKFLSEAGKEVTIEFRMEYFNTTCARCFLILLEKFEDYALERQGKVSVHWYYHDYDEDMRMSGEDYQLDLELDIKLIEYAES
ncbi:MAG: DUF1987 domain-containing protein [Bernardetiaceae bacterium]|nr:DUF1987 domain-containing protein [Bernardetiaceae bacterium]